jgi:carbon storage regulator
VLVLNRRRGEAIVLDGGIRIVVLDSDRRGARIGIEAPQETKIQREELVADISPETRRAGPRVDRRRWASAVPVKNPAG